MWVSGSIRDTVPSVRLATHSEPAAMAELRHGGSRSSPGPCRRGPGPLAHTQEVEAVPDVGAVPRVARLTRAHSGGREAPTVHVPAMSCGRVAGSTLRLTGSTGHVG